MSTREIVVKADEMEVIISSFKTIYAHLQMVYKQLEALGAAPYYLSGRAKTKVQQLTTNPGGNIQHSFQGKIESLFNLYTQLESYCLDVIQQFYETDESIARL